MKRVILIDIDDTLNDMLDKWIGWYNRNYDDQLDPREVIGWDLTKFVKPSCGREMYAYLDKPDLYDEVEPLPHAREVVERLQSNGDEVFLVSSCVPGSVDKKFRWAAEHFPTVDWKHYVACTNKWLIRGDVMIDDGPHNADGFEGRFIIFDKAHNWFATHLERAMNWKEIEQKLLS